METQKIPISKKPIGGTFIVLFYGKSTAPIPYNANDAEIQAAIDKAKG